MDSASVGSMMRSGIERFLKLIPKPNSLSTVDIVIFDQNMLQDFKDAILGDVAPRKGKFFTKIFEGNFCCLLANLSIMLLHRTSSSCIF